MRKLDLTGIKNIIFDLGGVIITLDRDEAVRRFLKAGLHNAEELLDPYHQKGIFLELEEGKISKEEFYDAVRKEAGCYISNEAIDHGWLGFLKEVPESKLKLLEDLKARGYNLYLLSNTNPVVMEWALSPAFSPQGKSLDQYFDKLYLSYQMKCVKPNLEIFRKLVKDADINPCETLFIDDGKANIEMGKMLYFNTYQPKNGEDFTGKF
ncbi:D-ribitol-5-phosphate phosphatase [Bacteroidia bacterium]|nr:D-ribitol-5-phosphate phosphatase [Bacteroidia bacterium]GHT03953.1 D-ribitol-5-phosphate phosphatase [Bacteroidia bacterium]